MNENNGTDWQHDNVELESRESERKVIIIALLGSLTFALFVFGWPWWWIG